MNFFSDKFGDDLIVEVVGWKGKKEDGTNYLALRHKSYSLFNKKLIFAPIYLLPEKSRFGIRFLAKPIHSFMIFFSTGKNTIRSYVPKNERLHFLRLIGGKNFLRLVLNSTKQIPIFDICFFL